MTIPSSGTVNDKTPWQEAHEAKKRIIFRIKYVNHQKPIDAVVLLVSARVNVYISEANWKLEQCQIQEIFQHISFSTTNFIIMV